MRDGFLANPRIENFQLRQLKKIEVAKVDLTRDRILLQAELTRIEGICGVRPNKIEALGDEGLMY